MKKTYNTPIVEIKMFETMQSIMREVGPADSAIDPDRIGVEEIIYDE